MHGRQRHFRLIAIGGRPDAKVKYLFYGLLDFNDYNSEREPIYIFAEHEIDKRAKEK